MRLGQHSRRRVVFNREGGAPFARCYLPPRRLGRGCAGSLATDRHSSARARQTHVRNTSLRHPLCVLSIESASFTTAVSRCCRRLDEAPPLHATFVEVIHALLPRDSCPAANAMRLVSDDRFRRRPQRFIGTTPSPPPQSRPAEPPPGKIQ